MTERKEKFTVAISPATLSRARAAALGIQRVDPTFTLGELVDTALQLHLEDLERTHNGGAAWPASHSLRPGRRIGGA